jgi:alkylation response protein AidB-like acyl-CoA dehydrogenase
LHFAYNEDQELLRNTTRKFLEQRQPIAVLRNYLETPITIDPGLWAEGAALGWTALLVPEEYDGGSITDQPIVDLAGLHEELGRQLYPGPVLETNLVADVIARHGSEALRAAHLRGIAHGETIATWCISSDGTLYPEAVAVTATIVANTLKLNGLARFVRDAHIADLMLVTAITPSGPELVLVPLPADGITIRVLEGLDLTRRLCEVEFNNVAVDLTHVISTPTIHVKSIIEAALRLATVLQAAECAGAARHLFEITVQYTKDRMQFGRAIGSFQAIKHRLADLHVRVEAITAAARYAALAVADETVDHAQAVAAAGSYVRESTAFLCGESLQLHGGIGFTWEHVVHLFLRRAKTDLGLYGDPWSHRERLCTLLEHTLLKPQTNAQTDAQAGVS